MPIEERTKVDIREEMAILALDGRLTITEIAHRFSVTRPTVRKWRERYRAEGRAGLEDRSHAPHSCPHKTSAAIEQMIVAERKAVRVGSKKILRRLQDEHPDIEFPSRTAVDGILKRNALVQPRRGRRKGKTPFAQKYAATKPGELMTLDFKGEFRLTSRKYCYPLTVMDSYSRYLLGCEALRSTSFRGTWPVLKRIFREHGLPVAVLSDNGPPFGPTGFARLSTMSIHLMRLDVQPVFIRPGNPQENGRHERMHLDLKTWATIPPEGSFPKQQKRFDGFQKFWNEERPHEALDLDRPVHRYQSSPRPYPEKIELPEYPGHFETRSVAKVGTFRWNGEYVFLGSPLAGERIGLERTGEALLNIYYYDYLIASFDEREGKII